LLPRTKAADIGNEQSGHWNAPDERLTAPDHSNDLWG
jgi:hypothetical protein